MTLPDKENTFWTINHFYPDDEAVTFLPVTCDSIERKFYANCTKKPKDCRVERLVKLKYAGNKISLTATPPIDIVHPSNGHNWEGIARLKWENGDGLLIITDEYPGTKLAFVPIPARPKY